MIYLDTSVALAHLLAEDRTPAPRLWTETLLSSRLFEYELWTRIHARGLSESHGDAARELTGRLSWIELTPNVLARALERFPVPVRTLDALHLSSFAFVRSQGVQLSLASYDDRMLEAARRMELPICAWC